MEKKKKKTKYQPLDFSMTVVKSTWAEDDDKDALPISDLSALREKLPSAPKAVRNAYDLSQLPSSGPWKARLSNLPFNVKEEEIVKFLGGDTEVKNIDIPYTGNRMRGFAIAEFFSREALANALSKTDDSIMGRRIPINLYTDDGYNDYSDSRTPWGSRRDDMRRAPRDDDDSDWRSAAIQSREDTIGRPERPPPANGDWSRGSRRPWQQDDDSRSNRRYDNRSNYDRYDSDRDGRDAPRRDWNRDNRDSDRSDYRPDRRERSNYDRDPRDRDGRDGWDRRDRDRDREGPPDNRDRRDQRSYDKPSETMRPRLNLQPRSKPIEPVNENGTDSSRSSIFGGAKPVDTASKEREIENRLEKEGRLITGDIQRRRQVTGETSDKEEMSQSGGSAQSGGQRPYRSRKSSDSSSHGKTRVPTSSSRCSDSEPTSPPIRAGNDSLPDTFDNSRRQPKSESSVSNEDGLPGDRNRRSSAAGGEPSVQVVDAPIPSVNIWQVRKSRMQKRSEEAANVAPHCDVESSRCVTNSNSSNSASPSTTSSSRNVPVQPAPEKEEVSHPNMSANPNQSSNDERKFVAAGDSASVESKDAEKEERVAPSQPQQVRRPPVVVSVSAAQRAAAEGQPPPPPIHENAWHNSQAAMDSVRRPPSPSRHNPGNSQSSYMSDRSYPPYQSHHPHSGHNDWQDGGSRMQRMDYRDNSGYRGSGYRGGGSRGWRGRGGGRGGYRGRGRGGYRYAGGDPSPDM